MMQLKRLLLGIVSVHVACMLSTQTLVLRSAFLLEMLEMKSQGADDLNGARASLVAKSRQLQCDKSPPMMRRLLNAVVKPTVSYGCELWGTLCSGTLQPGLQGIGGLQIVFLWLGLAPCQLGREGLGSQSCPSI